MALTEPHLVTMEELEGLPDDGCRSDLIRGELIRLSPDSRRHGRLASTLVLHLGVHVRDRDLGEVYTAETGFVLARSPDVVLAPDAAFVRKERLARVPEDSFLPFAPDLAVEVISPSDRAHNVNAKVQEYLKAGVRLLWVVEPHGETVTVYRSDRTARVLHLDLGDELSGEDVLPDLRLPLADLFR